MGSAEFAITKTFSSSVHLVHSCSYVFLALKQLLTWCWGFYSK